MNDTMIAFSYIQLFQPRAVMNFSRVSMVLKIQPSNNLIQLDIAYPRTPEWVKYLPIFYPTEFLVLDQHAAKQDFLWDKPTPFGIQQQNAISTTGWLKKGFAINRIYLHCLKH